MKYLTDVLGPLVRLGHTVFNVAQLATVVQFKENLGNDVQFTKSCIFVRCCTTKASGNWPSLKLYTRQNIGGFYIFPNRIILDMSSYGFRRLDEWRLFRGTLLNRTCRTTPIISVSIQTSWKRQFSLKIHRLFRLDNK